MLSDDDIIQITSTTSGVSGQYRIKQHIVRDSTDRIAYWSRRLTLPFGLSFTIAWERTRATRGGGKKR